MDQGTTYLSKEKHAELTAELETLMTMRRPEIAHQLEAARALGDLSENAEYQQARQTQGEVETRIKYLAHILKSPQIVTAQHGDTVGIGSTVVVTRDGDDEPRTYTIVGSEEADIALGRISPDSPFGQAMLGKKKGESFSMLAPSGKTLAYRIVKID